MTASFTSTPNTFWLENLNTLGTYFMNFSLFFLILGVYYLGIVKRALVDWWIIRMNIYLGTTQWESKPNQNYLFDSIRDGK